MATVVFSRLVPRLLASGLTLAALSSALLPARAQNPLSYSFVDLDRTGFSSGAGQVNGTAGGYAVGFGSGPITGPGDGSIDGYAVRAFRWDLSTGNRTALDSGIYRNTYAYGASDGLALGTGWVNNTALAAAWNLTTGAQVALDNTSFTNARAVAASGGYVVGFGAVRGGNTFASAWNLSTSLRTTLDNTGLTQSNAFAAGNGYAVGGGFGGTNGSTAYAWDLASGTRTTLDRTGFTGTTAYGVTNGYAVGFGRDTAASVTHALVWNLSTNRNTILNDVGLTTTYALGAGDGLAVGYGNGTTSSGRDNAMAWDISTNTRTNLQTTFMPSEATTSRASGAGADGNIVGSYTVNGNNRLFALVSFKPWQGDTLSAARTARVTGNVNQTTGVTTINGNYLFVGGAGQNTYTQAGGVLQGTGTIAGNVVNTGGILAVGNLPGSLTINGNYTQGASGVMNIALFDLANFDPLLVTGNTTLSGTLNFAFDPLFTGTLPEYVDLINTEGLLTGTFDNVNLIGSMPEGISGYSLSTVSNGGSGSVVRLNVVKAVPEIGTLLLMGLPMIGIAPLALARLRRK